MSDWFRIANEADIASPTILLYPERIQENLRRMIQGAGSADRLRPHVKTHKLPQVVRMKLDAGIRKFKTSTIAEAEMTAAAGGEDVLLAFPLVGPNIGRFAKLVKAFPKTRFSAIVDHPVTLRAMSAGFVAEGIDVDVYLDLNVGMERTGILPGAEAEALYREMCSTPGVRAAGFHAYDGQLINQTVEGLQADVETAFAPVWELRDRLTKAGFAVPKVIASGTPTFPRFGDHPDVEVGAGTTVLWDTGQPAACPDLDFLNAAVLLTRVVSTPRPNRICVDLGHKAVASEMAHPRATFFNVDVTKVIRHSEEHLVLETTRSDWTPGEVLYALPTHICPTMALHQEAWVVRDGRAVEAWPIASRARRMMY